MNKQLVKIIRSIADATGLTPSLVEKIFIESANEVVNAQINDITALQDVDLDRFSVEEIRKRSERKIIESVQAKNEEEIRGKLDQIITCTVTNFLPKLSKYVVSWQGSIDFEVFLSKTIPGERMAIGEEYLFVVLENKNGRGFQLSRSSPKFIEALMKEHIAAVSMGEVTIKKIVRKPGFKSIVVINDEEDRAAVGLCVGPGGANIQPINEHVYGEKIEVIGSSISVLKFIGRSFRNLNVQFRVQENEDRIAVIFADKDSRHASKIMGRGGLNIIMLSELFEKKLEVFTESSFAVSIESSEESAREVVSYFTDSDILQKMLIARLKHIKFWNRATLDVIKEAVHNEEEALEIFIKMIQLDLSGRLETHVDASEIKEIFLEKQEVFSSLHCLIISNTISEFKKLKVT